ncbi:MAG: glycosyltransferase [Bdellovibrionaceae bacterium]|nr:glycosyltransferase [Bdellovibrionales bacterium]MCB9084609.1 glycosyltransferase [Pseudobdellovibrionaceae bacterium]
MNHSPRPTVSIVIPVYNAEDYLVETLESLLAQTYTKVEILAVNDGSSDGSSEILQRYSEQVRVFSQANAGQAVALNKGWSMASGELFGYLSADDILKPGAIETLVHSLLNESDIIGVYPDYELINEKGQAIKEVHAPEFSLEDLVIKGICQPGPGAIFKRDAYERTGGWNPALRQLPDYDFWLRLTRFGELKRVPQTLAGFRVHEGSQSFAPSTPAKAEEPWQVMTQYFHQTSGLRESLKPKEDLALAHAHLLSARLHWRSGRKLDGNRHLYASIQHSPAAFFSPLGFKRFLSGWLGRYRYQIQHRIGKN